MIKIHLYPQLGNALFQTAAAEALAKRNDDNAQVTNFRHAELFGYERNQTSRESTFLWKENGFNYREIQYMPNLKLEGYFQSEKYFIDEEDYIREIFEIDKKYQFEKKVDTCAIHVRRGDYLSMEYFHPALTMEYYIRAKCELEDTIGHTPRYIVFSNDVQWCRENFTDSCYEIRDRQYNKGDWYDFSEMVSCNYHIIANSTFSWWGAWLAKSECVIAPDTEKRWFGPGYAHYNMKDLIPQNWKQV